MVKLIDKFNLYIKQDTKNSITEDTKPGNKVVAKNKDTKKNIKADNDLATNDDIRAYIIDKQKAIKKIYKSLLKTKKTIKNNIDLIYRALKKLSKESQPKLIELVRLDTILNDSINVIWHEIYERDQKGIKMIDINKIKNVGSLIHQLNIIINNKKLLLKTSVVAKLNRIINDINAKSNIGDVYNYNDKDKLFMIYNDLDNYMKYFKKDLGNIKQDFKTISVDQTESHKT